MMVRERCTFSSQTSNFDLYPGWRYPEQYFLLILGNGSVRVVMILISVAIVGVNISYNV